MFAVRFSQAASAGDKDRFIAEIRKFQGVVPGLKGTHVGGNLSPRSGGYEVGAVMLFVDQESLDAYQVSSVHTAFLNWAAPLVDGIDVDLWIEDEALRSFQQ